MYDCDHLSTVYNYDKTEKFEFRAPVIETGGGKSEAERLAELQEQSAAVDRANAGVASTSNAPVTNDKYANGTATGSYENTEA